MARKCDDCISTPLEAFEQGVYSIHSHEKRARALALANWMRSEQFFMGHDSTETFAETGELLWQAAALNGDNSHDYNF
jgi:hypothetical protein